MSLQSSGQIKLSEIAAEFGGTVPHALSEYYGVGGVQSTGPLKFSDFFGAYSELEILFLDRDLGRERILINSTRMVDTAGSLIRVINFNGDILNELPLESEDGLYWGYGITEDRILVGITPESIFTSTTVATVLDLQLNTLHQFGFPPPRTAQGSWVVETGAISENRIVIVFKWNRPSGTSFEQGVIHIYDKNFNLINTYNTERMLESIYAAAAISESQNRIVVYSENIPDSGGSGNFGVGGIYILDLNGNFINKFNPDFPNYDFSLFRIEDNPLYIVDGKIMIAATRPWNRIYFLDLNGNELFQVKPLGEEVVFNASIGHALDLINNRLIVGFRKELMFYDFNGNLLKVEDHPEDQDFYVQGNRFFAVFFDYIRINNVRTARWGIRIRNLPN